MKRIFVYSVFLTFLFTTPVFSGCGFTSGGRMIGKKAPSFTLRSTDGKSVKLSDFKNKIVLIDFWATWCPPCRKGIPDLIAIQKEFPKDVVVIGISVDDDRTKADVPGFVKQYGINYPIVYSDGKVPDQYGGIEGIPTAFIVDKKGIIVDSHVGLVSKSVYVDVIRKLLKK